MIISLSGLDGAGKSTQIARLTDYLRSRGLSVSTLMLFEQVSLSGLLQRLRPKSDPVAGAEDSGDEDRKLPPTYRCDKNDRSWSLFVVRMVVYVVDAMSVLLFKSKSAIT